MIKISYIINKNDFISVPFEMQFINLKRFYTGGTWLIAITKSKRVAYLLLITPAYHYCTIAAIFDPTIPHPSLISPIFFFIIHWSTIVNLHTSGYILSPIIANSI